MISAPGGMAPLAETLWNLSLSTMTTALGIVAWPSHNLPNLIALVAASAFAQTARQSAHNTHVMARLDPHFRGDATQPARVRALIEYCIAWMAAPRFRGDKPCGP